MRPIVSVLSDLIVTAEEIITRPTLDMPLLHERFNTLAAEVRHHDRLPAEDIRTTRAAMVFVTAIEEFRSASKERAPQWLMLAGATLPLLRQEAFDAFSLAREARHSHGRFGEK